MSVFLITPPFTQLNTPYPATPYLQGFLKSRGIASRQADLGIEVILEIFSKPGMEALFARISRNPEAGYSENARRMIALQAHYIRTMEPVMLFLQGKNPSYEHQLCQEGTLPEASRFDQLADLDWAFGAIGTHDRAKHLATLYLEDVSDLIRECIDPNFGFSRYAERLGRSASEFDELYAALNAEYTYIDEITIRLLEKHMSIATPSLVAVTVPFPGNLYAAFRCAQWIKTHCPGVKTAIGGGFANTELRSLAEPRVFEFFDFVTLDDGEAPIEHLFEHIEGRRPVDLLKRSFVFLNGQVEYMNFSPSRDYKQAEVGTPDYSDLPLDRYISVLEIANPMHRLWSDGRWNKLTMAHGCYWGKCTFCDISLDYIGSYEPNTARMLCDRMEELIRQTGETGFHFVDEAAPPALMRALALEILRRGLVVSWWTNIRFEKSFTRDLCRLLQASGCVAVSGGLEVASDRLLALIQKGVTVDQVAQVARNLTEAGIMVHAYLMYGFPTQTAQETIDSLENVRQMFEAGIIQSGFWHQFAMTAHSPVGLAPVTFGVTDISGATGKFANNDRIHLDKRGADHDRFSFGLKKSLLNYMHGIGFDFPLQDWFDMKVPETAVAPDYIARVLQQESYNSVKISAKLVWLGEQPVVSRVQGMKKGKPVEKFNLTFHSATQSRSISVDSSIGRWMTEILLDITPARQAAITFQEFRDSYSDAGLDDFDLFWLSRPADTLREFGLLVL